MYRKKGKRFLVSVVFVILLLCMIANIFLPLYFSQDYREISGIENIIFQPNGYSNVFYKRCFWGLSKIEPPTRFSQYKSGAYTAEIDILQENIGLNHEIRQAIASPDGNYILYCEIEYGYKNTGMTDDEFYNYRVYNINTKEIITIYQAYREWYHLDWQ